ncbi:MAG: TonB-dependent receptor [Flavobacteriales bacterium]|nr:TonB-dependent receptor [Flavobacteriales bacterium]
MGKPTYLQSLITCIFLLPVMIYAQRVIEGTVYDPSTGDAMIGAAVVVQGTTEGTTTDIDGNFKFETNRELPINLVVSFIGFEEQLIVYEQDGQKLKIKLNTSAQLLEAFDVVDFRVSEKQRQEPLTVERMDIIAIKETPADNFYDGLASLKGVDITAASLGFKVINTRGFNSTSPVRSLQLIDGRDNQSPGLNFSLANFLGTSDLDVMRVDIIAGASSAFYGPGAFNGVINMTTKDPWVFPGLAVSTKLGERNLQEYAFRWAQVIKNKEGKPKFAYKINAFYMSALDWFAENYEPIDDGDVEQDNPGGFDAVNIYGDEENDDRRDILSKFQYPGYGIVHRDGYKEIDLADYGTENLKLNTALYYRITDSVEISYAFNYGTGTTIYQGDNRYSLKGIQFMQNQVEIGKKGTWFVRGYSTNEDAGQSYDIVTTGVRMVESTITSDINGNDNWFTRYRTIWGGRDYARELKQYEGYPDLGDFGNDTLWAEALDVWMEDYSDTLNIWHQRLRDELDEDPRAGIPAYEVGSQRFDSAFSDITSRNFTEGGALFYDKSALYHVQGEYIFDLAGIEIATGGNYRWYRPNSRGTIFQDTLSYERTKTDSGAVIKTDSNYRVIQNEELGFYIGLSRSFFDKKLLTNFTLRVDKNQNFDFLLSPAVSVVYSPNANHTFRSTFSSAIRNPTLADQYLYYNVGRAILLGNLEGYDSLLTVGSFVDYLSSLNRDTLDYFNADPIQPEKVKTIEVGYRGIWWEKVYFDITAYQSWYNDFIGYLIGVDSEFDAIGFPRGTQVYRLAANAENEVQTRGVSAGFNYFYAKKHALNGNYSFNRLTSGADDPIIPAYNTPEHKYNIGISGRDIMLPILKFGRWGYGINYRWVEGFRFEGSPQFTGDIESYGLLNAQANFSVPKWHSTLKIGASNILNNQVRQVYGGPLVGRLAYVSLLFDWNRAK